MNAGHSMNVRRERAFAGIWTAIHSAVIALGMWRHEI